MEQETAPPPTKDAEVHYDLRTDRWVASNGDPVCQDHAVIEPCDYTHGRRKLQ